jgi:hypothetical protein
MPNDVLVVVFSHYFFTEPAMSPKAMNGAGFSGADSAVGGVRLGRRLASRLEGCGV